MFNMQTIGVFFGSRSPEHDVSIITGEFIISGLKGLGFPVVPVYIGKEGEWYIADALASLSYFTSQKQDIATSGFERYYLDLQQSRGKLVLRQKRMFGKSIAIDIAFPALHGSYGEDGAIQGLFEMFDVPYVGCDVSSSAIAMDKVLTKHFYQALGIPTTKFISFTSDEWREKKNNIHKQIMELPWPVFVKPARLGSSIGIKKVKDENDLGLAIEVSLRYDTKTLVEESVENLMDVTCCIIGNENPAASLLQESVFDSDLFDYEEKYLKKGGTQLGKAAQNIVIPARLDEDTTRSIMNSAIKIYQELGCSGIARVDFLYNKKTREWFANEINPLPGTLYHHLWKKSGVPFNELLTRLISFAKERHEARRAIIYTFASSLLAKTGGEKLGHPPIAAVCKAENIC